jgi:Ca2+-binding EF-hand superfamily protein
MGGGSIFGSNFDKKTDNTANETFDKIDIDGSGTLDVKELAQALKTVAFMGGRGMTRLGIRTRVEEALTELSARLVRLYDVNGDGVVDRQEYQMLVQDMAAVRSARMSEEKEGEKFDDNNSATDMTQQSVVDYNSDGSTKKKNWFTSFFFNRKTTIAGSKIDITDTTTKNGEIWDLIEEEDDGEGSLVLEGLNLDLRQFLFGSIPGVMKRLLPGGPLILKPFTATLTCSFNRHDIMESILLDTGLRRLVARALSRRVRGVRDLLDGAVFYGRTWKTLEQNAPLVEIAKLENVQFDNRNRLIITGRAKIKEALGYKHDPIEQGFKVRTKIGTRSDGRIIGLLEPEIAIFFECPKEFEMNVRDKFRQWFGYTIPVLQPLYTFIPLVSPLKKNDNMDGFNLGEDNQIKFIDIKNGKLLIEFSALLRPGRFLGNHYLAFTVPNRTLILTLDRVKEAMRNARRNKRLAELAAREVTKLQSTYIKPYEYISQEGKARIRRLEEELKATIQEEAILREMKDNNSKTTESEKSFFSRFIEGYVGALRKGVDLKMNARLSSSISDFFGSQDGEIKEEDT